MALKKRSSLKRARDGGTLERHGRFEIHKRKPKYKPDLEGVKPRPAPGGVYLPDHLLLVRAIAMRGYTDEEIAEHFGVGPGAIEGWKTLYPDFREALESGRTHADAEVVVSLYKRATGYDYDEETAVGGRSPSVMKVRRHAPPDLSAIKLWLTNRQAEHWGDRQQHEHSGRGGGPIEVQESKEDIMNEILELVRSKPDG